MASVGDISATSFQLAAFPPIPVCRLAVDRCQEMIRGLGKVAQAMRHGLH